MAWREDLRALLKATLPGVPVDWGWNRQGKPGLRVTLTVASGQDGVTHSGASGLNQRRVQVDCYAPAFKAARDAADTIRAALHGARTARFSGVFLVAERDLPPDTTAGETLARISLDLMVHYLEE